MVARLCFTVEDRRVRSSIICSKLSIDMPRRCVQPDHAKRGAILFFAFSGKKKPDY